MNKHFEQDITQQAHNKTIKMLRDTLSNNLLPALNTLNQHKNQLNAQQLHDLSQVNDIADRMNLMTQQSLQPDGISSSDADQFIDNDDINQLARIDRVMQALTHASSFMDSNEFFYHCVKTLTEIYDCKYALISILEPDQLSVSTIAVWSHGKAAGNISYPLEGTPCQDVICLKKIFISEGVAKQYPNDALLIKMQADSYFGSPLMTKDHGTLGLVAVLDDQPMQINQWSSSILSVFTARITGEVLRKQALDKLAALNSDLENQVFQRTQELQQSNLDLEAFNYSVSHDLRSPVRTINSFLDVIFEDYGETLPEGAVHELQRIHKAGHRLDSIIDGLLGLSRISQHKIQAKQIDLSELANRTMNNILTAENRLQTQVKIATNLLAWGDENLLQIALDNLLSNALKYSQHNPQSIITFSVQQQDDEQVFCIQDNGVGFNMEYANQLFQAFKRLHTEKEFPGTGIGLATVKRIFDCHNGRIWADSSGTEGACFYFTLPSPNAIPTQIP